jgi:carbohydrate kinase (thermoresistant glucokinase family)
MLAGDTAVVVVMGVSGSGKSTIASMLTHRLNWFYEDGDWFHPQSNIEKMHHGDPLDEKDRWPWLHAIANWPREIVETIVRKLGIDEGADVNANR